MKRISGSVTAILLVAALCVLLGCEILLQYRIYATGTLCTAQIVEITVRQEGEGYRYDALLEYVVDGTVYTTRDSVSKNRWVGEERLIRYDPERPHVVYSEPGLGRLVMACFVLVWLVGDAITQKLIRRDSRRG